MNILANYFEKIKAEVEQGGDTAFDGLETLYPPGSDWVDVASEYVPGEYPGNFFQRKIIASATSGTTELKRLEIETRWPRRGGGFNQIRNVFLISRPSPPLPGNIKGSVYDNLTGTLIQNAEIEVTFISPVPQPQELNALTYSKGQLDADNCNFDFSDPGTGFFKLISGDWSLTITAEGYYDYNPTPPYVVNVPEAEEVILPPIYLDPKPQSAHIRGRVVDENSHPLYQYISLYRDGSYLNREHMWWHRPRSFDFEIDFNEPEEKCFTLITSSGGSGWSYPYRYNQHCGNFCGPEGWGKSYNYRGWSSAVVQEDGSKNCANPWFGSSTTDRICVNPGDDLDLGDIVLVSVPLATVKGYVYDTSGSPLAGARIYIRWHDGAHWNPYPAGSTNSQGFYQVSVPAAQELFPDDTNHYITMLAGRNMPKSTCCGEQGTQWKESGWIRVGPLYRGDTRQVNFTIPSASDDECGDAQGYVRDGRQLFLLSGVRVKIGGKGGSTNGAGYYKVECPPGKDGCRIPVGRHVVEASKGNYYTFRSDGSWPYQDRPEIQIIKDMTVSYEEIRLYPKGYGTIRGRVLDASTNEPIEGAEVWLDIYNNNYGPKYDSLTDWHYNKTTTTNSDGGFEFTHIIETWPPPDIDGNYYQTGEKKHLLAVTYSSEYIPRTLDPFTLNANQNLDLGDIYLTKKGQF